MSNSARPDLKGARPLFGALAVAMLGNGLLGTVVGIRAELENFPTATSGLVMSSFYVGFLVACAGAPRFLGRVGHLRAFAALSIGSAITALAYPAFPNPAAWAILRFLTGAAAAGIYVTCESWLAGAGPARTRGRLLAAYLLVVNSGYGLGQLLLGIGSPAGARLFGISAVLIALSVLPLVGMRGRRPPQTYRGRLRLLDLARISPLGAATSFATGIGVGTVLGFGAVYGTAAGMSPGRVGLLMGTAMAGGLVLQWPIGALSDRIDRRLVIVAAAFLAGAIAVAGAFVEPRSVAILACVFGFTGFCFPLYSLAISHVNDSIDRRSVVAASSTLLAVYGLGTLVGPFGTSLVIEAMGPAGFWLLSGLAHLALGLYGTSHLVRRQPTPDVPRVAAPQAVRSIEEELGLSRPQP